MSDPTGPKPAPIPPPDRYQIERLNELYRILDAPVEGGLKARLASTVRRLLSRVLSRQQEFNAVLVDHLNRNAAVGIESHQASLQTIEWMAAVVQHWDDIHRSMESLAARSQRTEASVAALAAQHDELRSAVSVLQQASQSLKRALNSQLPTPGSEASTPTSQLPTPKEGQGVGAAAPGNQFDDLDSHKYVAFEDQFRGSADDIRARVTEYLPVFAGTSDVLDVGCGRGEFLALLRDHAVTARGIDVNPAMVDVCRTSGLDAQVADALTYLRSLPDGSLGGLFAAQVVEHLEPRYLMQFIDAAFDKLRPGAPIVLETINPACWFAFFESYIRDLTHVRPVHPDTLKHLLVASGFQHVEIRYRAPYPEHDKLQQLGVRDSGSAVRETPVGIPDLVETLNANVEKINRLLFTYLDYAAVGRRG